MRDAPYLNRNEANAARSRRRQAAAARPVVAEFATHLAHGFDTDRDGTFATSVQCECSIGHDHEDQR